MIEAHLSKCRECTIELARHLEVAAMLSTTDRFAPPTLWSAISADLAQPSLATNVIPMRKRWLKPIGAAAVVVLFAGAAAVQSVRLNGITEDLATERETVAMLSERLNRPVLETAVVQALASPGSRRVNLGSQVSGSNAIIVLMPDGTGYLAEHTLRPLPADRTYQLWAIVDGKVISAGVLGSDPDVVPFHIGPEGFDGFAITEEMVGGVEASQNDAIVAWFEA